MVSLSMHSCRLRATIKLSRSGYHRFPFIFVFSVVGAFEGRGASLPNCALNMNMVECNCWVVAISGIGFVEETTVFFLFFGSVFFFVGMNSDPLVSV